MWMEKSRQDRRGSLRNGQQPDQFLCGGRRTSGGTGTKKWNDRISVSKLILWDHTEERVEARWLSPEAIFNAGGSVQYLTVPLTKGGLASLQMTLYINTSFTGFCLYCVFSVGAFRIKVISILLIQTFIHLFIHSSIHSVNTEGLDLLWINIQTDYLAVVPSIYCRINKIYRMK